MAPLAGQQAIDGTINFQSDPAKKYSLYIPSNYDAAVENPAFLALHPLNTRRWNAESWRDTLITFAETNDLILIAPDGGPDGRIDDPIDTAFTTYLLDSMFRAYNIDEDELYVVGFSWGGRTTYTYGLSNTERFAGYMPIGAAINGTREIAPVIANAKDEAFFVIHGSRDIPDTRYHPAVEALKMNGACVNENLIFNLGHTIDFASRDMLLTLGYKWLVDQNCGATSISSVKAKEVGFSPNPINVNQLKVRLSAIGEYKLVNAQGQEVPNVQNLLSGIHFLYYQEEGQAVVSRLVLVE